MGGVSHDAWGGSKALHWDNAVTAGDLPNTDWASRSLTGVLSGWGALLSWHG